MDARIQSIESYQRKTKQLIEQCKALTDTTANASLTEILGDVSVFNNIAVNCLEIQRDLDILKGTTNDNINIICVGNTSTGKSSLINALIGKAIMPSSTLITTRCFTRLSRSDRNMVVNPDGETTICSSDEMVKDAINEYMDRLTETNEITEAEIQIYLDIDSPILRNNVYLYDSPGEGHSDLIKHRCKDMDIMIIVMPYNITIDIENNYEYLANDITKIPVFILINKWDEADKTTKPKQILDVKESIKSFVKRAFITPHNIESEIDNDLLFYISAKEIMSCYPYAPGNAKCRQRYDDFQNFKSRLSERIMNCVCLKDKRFKEIMTKVVENYNQQQNMYNTRKMEIRNQFRQRVSLSITDINGIRMQCDQLTGSMNGEVFRRILEQSNHILGRLMSIETPRNNDDFHIISQNGIFTQIKEDVNDNQRRYNAAVTELNITSSNGMQRSFNEK